jgi:hypothetical protein
MCTLITSKGTDMDENIANQIHATRTRTPKPGYLKLPNICVMEHSRNPTKILQNPEFESLALNMFIP